MSGFSYPPPTFVSSVYNPAFYLSIDATGFLTYEYAQTLYLSKNDFRLTYLSGISAGVAQAGTALVLDNSLSISGLGSISCSSLTVAGSAITTAPAYTIGITPGVAAASKALVLDASKNIVGINSLCLGTSADTSRPLSILNGSLTPGSSLYGVGFGVANSSNNQSEFSFNYVASGSTSNSFAFGLHSNVNILRISGTRDVDITYHDGSSIGLRLGGVLITASASEINYIDVVAGTGTASKALVLNSSKDISGINSLVATQLTGTIQTASQPLITSIGTQASINALEYKLGGSIIDFSGFASNTYLSGITPGSASASKALVVDANRDISNINSLTATNLTGTLQTAAQTNITSIGTLASLNIIGSANGGLTIKNPSAVGLSCVVFQNDGTSFVEMGIRGSNGVGGSPSHAYMFFNSAYVFRVVPSTYEILIGTATATGAHQLNVGGSIKCTSLTGTLATAAQPTITSVGTLSSLTVSGALNGTLATAAQPTITSVGTLTSLSTGSITLGGTLITSTAAKINYLDITTAGSAEASKALVVDSNKDVSNINRLNATLLNAGKIELTGKGQVLYSLAGSSTFRMYHFDSGDIQLGSISSNDLYFLTANSFRLRVHANGVNIFNHNGSTGGLWLNDVLVTATAAEINYLDTTPGSAEASKALVVDANKDITSIRNLTATSLTGTLQTVAQPNITSVGTLTSLSTGDITLNGTLISASASELNYTDLTTLGTFQASKAMTLDGSGVGKFALGSRTTNCIQWSGGTANRETVSMYRESDDGGLVIATTPITIYKATPLLTLLSGDGLNTGNHSAGIIELLRTKITNTRMAGLDEYYAGLWTGYDLGTPPWATGFADYSQFYTSQPALNIACGTSDVSTYASSGNILLLSSGRIVQNGVTPYSSGTWGNADITLNGGNINLKCSNNLNANSSLIDMPLKIDSSRSSNQVQFAIQISNEDRTDTTKAAYIGTLSNSDFALKTNNTERMRLTTGGRLGIGNTSPRCPLEVSGNASFTIGVGGTATGYFFNDTNNTWANLGLGPVTASSVSGYFSGNIYALGMYASSDRRLKTDISELNIGFEQYQLLKPSIYRFKSEDKFRMGLIAQDTLNVFGELVSFSENENMKPSDDANDLDKIQLSIDYQQLTAINCSMIKKLITKVESQSEDLRRCLQSERQLIAELVELKKTITALSNVQPFKEQTF